ncbi:TPA: hypothetical protein O4G90_002381 [Citrobacter amalonaticus]|nr:hypothetical protein [Citrobacter amalonaticus]
MAHACKISDIIRQLQQYQNDDFVLYSLWYTDDVRSIDASVPEEEAIAVLQHADQYHDAEQGINWFTLEASLDAIRQQLTA